MTENGMFVSDITATVWRSSFGGDFFFGFGNGSDFSFVRYVQLQLDT